MDAWIDPTTADYRAQPGGGLQADPAGGLANAVYLRLVTPVGSWWADPTLGSRLHELKRAKAVAGIEIQAQEWVRQALAPLVADGRAQSVDVLASLTVRPDGSKALYLLCTVVDAAGVSRTFEHYIKVG